MRYVIYNSNFRHTVDADDREEALKRWARENPELASQTIIIKPES